MDTSLTEDTSDVADVVDALVATDGKLCCVLWSYPRLQMANLCEVGC